jgi:uncharacterized membrane protein
MSVTTTARLPKPRQSALQWIGSHWFETFLVVYGVWVFSPFLAPLFMQMGWTVAGKTVYFIYSFFCHQLPERSFFLFGQKPMYSLSEIKAVWQNTTDPMVLRQFTGNETMGWKIAWSDRMISFYTSIWLFAAISFPLRRRVKPLSWWGLVLLLLPIALDGLTHMVSDFAGIGQGFRDTNVWLAVLTKHAFPTSFYAGDALGSFNSLMRFVTGLLAGFAVSWLVFPYLFQLEVYDQQLDKIGYAQVIEQIKNENPRSSGR